MALVPQLMNTLQGIALDVLVFLSDIIFKWIPATIAVALGLSPSQATYTGIYDALYVSTSTNASTHTAQGTQSNTQTTPGGAQVSLDSTSYNASGQQVSQGTIGSPSTVTTGSVQQPQTATQMQATTTSPTQNPQAFAGTALSTAWGIFAPLSIFLSLLVATWILYSLIRLLQLRSAEHKAHHEAMHAAETHPAGGPTHEEGPSEAQKRWARVEQQIVSENENDWRLAILEADIMLDEMLDANGFQGDTIGDKLKSATRGDFKTLSQAWDAHRVRNHIAHRGTMHDINHREAKRVIDEYKAVFHEFHWI